MIFKRNIITITALFAGLISVVHSAMINPQNVDALLQPYLAIQQGLANDNLKIAKHSAGDYLRELELASSDVKNTKILNLKIAAEQIFTSENLDEARNGFLIASILMENLISSVGTTSNPQLYVFYCPVAFDNKGGSWIQSAESVENPYLGLMMPVCGSIKKQISGNPGSQKNGPMEHDHGSHSDSHSAPSMLMPAIQEIIENQGDDYPAVCVVSDEPLIDGEIEQFSYEGKLVRFCCKGCKKDFIQDPEYYLLKLDKLKENSPVIVGDQHSGHDHSGHVH